MTSRRNAHRAWLVLGIGLVAAWAGPLEALPMPSRATIACAVQAEADRPAPRFEAAALLPLAPGLRHDVLERALVAAEKTWSVGPRPARPLLTVIDYSLPSTKKRLWVFDLATTKLLYHELVAHGAGTGDRLAEHFSNRPNSRCSSLGMFLTGESYVGRNGYSLRLDGLDPGVNCRARERAIVLHGASYVSAAHAREYGRLGRSWGCPAVGSAVARTLIDTIRGGSLLYCYGADPEWLASTAVAAPAPPMSSSAATIQSAH